MPAPAKGLDAFFTICHAHTADDGPFVILTASLLSQLQREGVNVDAAAEAAAASRVLAIPLHVAQLATSHGLYGEPWPALR